MSNQGNYLNSGIEFLLKLYLENTTKTSYNNRNNHIIGTHMHTPPIGQKNVSNQKIV
jgi:hypothetical protein